MEMTVTAVFTRSKRKRSVNSAADQALEDTRVLHFQGEKCHSTCSSFFWAAATGRVHVTGNQHGGRFSAE